MTEAYKELYSSTGDMMDELCKLGCDIMYGVADLTGYTYLEANVCLFYIVQPVIYILFMAMGIQVLIQKFHRNRWLYLLYALPCWFLGRLYALYHASKWDAVGAAKIDSMYAFAHHWGITYAQFNVCVFAIFFIVICLVHLTLMACRKRIGKYTYLGIAIALTCISPLFIFAFYT